MIIFNWKYPEKEQYPPEPQATKDGWKLDDPGMSSVEIMEWYEAHFEMYACRLFGEDGPVPAQLYYIGDNEFMSETGHVFKEGMVTAWDSYTEDVPEDSEYPAAQINLSVREEGIGVKIKGNLSGTALGALAMITVIADQNKRTVVETFDWLRDLWTNEVAEMIDE
jgi:hypothetical protein